MTKTEFIHRAVLAMMGNSAASFEDEAEIIDMIDTASNVADLTETQGYEFDSDLEDIANG